jgi:hypothetical protein
VVIRRKERRILMCNTAAGPQLELKRTSGYGWKLVRPGFTELVGQDKKRYLANLDGWIRWDRSLAAYPGIGFCGFTTKKEAQRAFRAWPWSVEDGVTIQRIQYKSAVCRKMETGFASGYVFEVILFKQFRFLSREALKCIIS